MEAVPVPPTPGPRPDRRGLPGRAGAQQELEEAAQQVVHGQVRGEQPLRLQPVHHRCEQGAGGVGADARERGAVLRRLLQRLREVRPGGRVPLREVVLRRVAGTGRRRASARPTAGSARGPTGAR